MLKQFFPYAVTIVLGLQINDLLFLPSQNIVLWLLIVAPIWVALCYGTRFIFWKASQYDKYDRYDRLCTSLSSRLGTDVLK
jgi:hypothetical protein